MPQSNEIAPLTEAAAKVNRSAPAFASLVFDRARLLIANNRNAEARTLLDQALNDDKAFPRSAINALTSQRMILAANLTDFLSNAHATKKPQAAPPEFLKTRQPEASREVAVLQALGTVPNYLCQTVINWANANPVDARVPEALHLALKSTPYGCTDKDTGRWSKAAFDLLHRKYPNNSWAKETKYWFKG
jgi:hypothetical protein